MYVSKGKIRIIVHFTAQLFLFQNSFHSPKGKKMALSVCRLIFRIQEAL